MIDACDTCLRRSYLVGFLAADVERLVPKAGSARTEAVEASNESLLAAVPEARRAEACRFLESFDPDVERSRLSLDAACVHAGVYPSPLRDLRTPPPVLYATSLEPIKSEPRAAVVGSRRPSEYGRTVAYGIGRGLGSAAVPVVSGLALGIDAIAQRGCLDGGAPTVAVLAGGADLPYPRTNRHLYERIRHNGCIVSEMPPGTRPHRWLFPARNRVMAALGQVTVVVEATERSGTLITADCAADLGRDVAAVPGNVTSDVAAGTNALLRTGAALVTGAQDVLDLLYGVGVREIPRAPSPQLDPCERQLLQFVGRGAGMDVLVEQTGLTAGAVRSALARLELKGLVRRAASGSYVPAA